MCGRLNVSDSPLVEWLAEELGVAFATDAKPTRLPTDRVDVLVAGEQGLNCLATRWGVRRDWSQKILINARAETVAETRSWRQAFESRRCVVPCSGWYEKKHNFALADGTPALMAGIWLPEDTPSLVTLTCEPNRECGRVWKRMPQLLHPADIETWLWGEAGAAHSLIGPSADDSVVVRPV